MSAKNPGGWSAASGRALNLPPPAAPGNETRPEAAFHPEPIFPPA